VASVIGQMESGQGAVIYNALNAQKLYNCARNVKIATRKLTFVALIVSDRGGRAITSMTQSLASAVFLPVGLLK